MKNKAVFCIATSEAQAQTITNRLRESGFSGDDISVLFPDRSGTRDFAHEQNTKAPEGTVTGVSTGGAIGGALGWMIGIGALAIPGVGPFIAAGPIMALLAGAAVGATVGGITGALIGMGIPEYEAKRYEGKIKAGNILISVHTTTSEDREKAKRIFTDANAQDIATSSEASADDAEDADDDEDDSNDNQPTSTRTTGDSSTRPAVTQTRNDGFGQRAGI